MAQSNYAIIRRADGSPEEKVLKGTQIPLRPGDVVTFYTAGGGGYGDPSKRTREAIAGRPGRRLCVEGRSATQLRVRRMTSTDKAASRPPIARAAAICAAPWRPPDIDALLLYGNNWHADYLRYASDFGIVEGQGLALFERDGSVTLLLDDAAEAERARAETAHEVVWAHDLVGAAKALLLRGGNRRVAGAPYHLAALWPCSPGQGAASLRRR